MLFSVFKNGVDNMGDNLISIKEYAESRGKTVQAVYNQIHGKEKADLLEGHIITQKAGHKNIKFIDETAVRILDEASKQAPTVILQNEDKERIAELTAENEALKIQLMELQNRMIDEVTKHNEQIMIQSQKVIELTDKVLLLEQKNQEQEQHKSLWNRLFK